MTATPCPVPNRAPRNDWRQVPLPALAEFAPTRPVSVVIPSYNTPTATLARTFAALEGQAYPPGLFEVVLVDDGSSPPLVPPPTPLAVKLLRQARRGFGLARARNAGAAAAKHDILLFLDADVLVEADWLAAHARWHHAVSDVVTVGRYADVAVDGLDAEGIRARAGSLAQLLAGRAAAPRPGAEHLLRTNMLTTADDPYRALLGGNFGVGRPFYALVGGHDESFRRWGFEEIEFGYRAHTRGGLFAPVPEAFGWHQGLATEAERAERRRSLDLQRAKCANLIAHPAMRGPQPGRSYAVPGHVVTLAADASLWRRDGIERLLVAVATVLADRESDLVVRVQAPAQPGGDGAVWLREAFGADPRVYIAAKPALAEYPLAPFHIVASPPAVARGFGRDLVRRLRRRLAGAVRAEVAFPGGGTVSITRTWALHRAARVGGAAPADFGDAKTLPRRVLGRALADRRATAESLGHPTAAQRLRVRVREVRGWRELAAFARWSWAIAPRRLRRRAAQAVPRLPPSLWQRGIGRLRVAWWRLQRARRSRRARAAAGGKRADAGGGTAPAFDLAGFHPIGWQRPQARAKRDAVAALGPLRLLPPTGRASLVVRRGDLRRLRQISHLEDVAALHPDVVARARVLARLAGAGVATHLLDRCPRLEALLGRELFGLMVSPPASGDFAERELHGVRMQRAALREHSAWACECRLGRRAFPTLSVLLATKRPHLLKWAVAGVARQTYPSIELILGLHGDGFNGLERHLAAFPHPHTVVRAAAAEPLGGVLGRLSAAASGAFVTKMDDDDLYGADHLWDLMLAREYSQADLVGKWLEFIYLARRDRTIAWQNGASERYQTSHLAGPSLLLARDTLERAGGWRPATSGVDAALQRDVLRAGGRLYRTHSAGMLMIRHGRHHTWDDAAAPPFLARADRAWPGFDPHRAGVEPLPNFHPGLASRRRGVAQAGQRPGVCDKS